MSEPLCTVVGEEIEADMWRLECLSCGWSTLVPEVERIGATLGHLSKFEEPDPILPGMVVAGPERGPTWQAVLLLVVVMLALAGALWWLF